MEIKAHAKINLILKIFPKTKSQVKHRVHSLFVSLPNMYDLITINPSSTTQIKYVHENKIIKVHNELINKALIFINRRFNLNIQLNILIKKKIPLSSGLGGSSTDAATVLLWIIKTYHLKLIPKDLKYIALNLSSDIPFFLSEYKSAWVAGYGEKIKSFNNKINYKIIFTNIRVETKKVYSLMNSRSYVSQINVRNAYSELVSGRFNKNTVYNDMWIYANIISQRLKKISRKLLNERNIVLSGSGGTLVEILQ